MTTKKETAAKVKTPKTSTGKKEAAAKAKTANKQLVAKQNKTHFPIVGIGASAGGLKAFEQFFSAMPVDSGIAFVLVAHLDPSHASMLPELLQRKTSMKVHQVSDNMKVVPNQVFIIPPNKEMAIINGTLQLLELRKPRGANLPIDIFLRSLAQDQGNKAIGIILSGTGTDGTLGLRAIKGEAGMVMVQDMASAEYDGMPSSAIATGLADYILAPENMPAQLLKYAQHQERIKASTISSDDENMLSALQKIFILLRAATGHDFSLYKRNTICRRIERRMHVHQIDKINDYVRYLQESERETATLFKELLIGVTSFFRDPEAFEALKEHYLPELLQDKDNDYQLRIWVPGCSSGEEAYSVAIILQECMDIMGCHLPVQIFGTDLDDNAIDLARAGLYPESISADVSPERLRKFFTRTENHYQIKKSIREMVVFAPQNVIKDPPFTKLDLLCCRNLLIYFGPELQKKLLPIFYYSLKEDGILFLGASESIGQAATLFSMVDKKWKIFKRHPEERAGRPVLDFATTGRAIQMPVAKEAPKPIPPFKEANTISLLKTILSQSDMPPAVVIDDRADIIYIHGRTGHFLEPAEGETTSNLLEMARPGLKAGLTNAIRKMATERQNIIQKGLQVKNDDDSLDVDLIIRPLPDMQTGRRGLMLVIFEEVAPPPGKKKARTRKPAQTAKLEDIQRLEDELHYTKENLQTTIEELETSNEELKSTNEELQSTNEELQSTNEELETSKEELQSLNEESATVNSELQSRIDELVAANDDIKNLLDATDIASLFLDIDLNIRRFTSKTTEVFPLTATDLGRPIRHFASSLQGVDLHEHAQKVLQDLEKQELEVPDKSGLIYRIRLRPYRTVNNVIDGVVITFEDITRLRQLLEQERRLAAIVRDSNDAITLQDLQGNIIAWNKGAEDMYGYSEEEALKMNADSLVPPEGLSEYQAASARVLAGDKVEPFMTKRLTKDARSLQAWITVTRLVNEQGETAFIATTERDMDRLKQ